MTFTHPSYGQHVATGEGLGSITTSMTADRAVHDVAADGSIMTSKIRARNGSHAIVIQQTSPLDQWLTKLFNYLETAATSEWASLSVTQRAPGLGNLITSTGVTIVKQPDRPFQAQGQQITWNLIAADVQQDVI